MRQAEQPSPLVSTIGERCRTCYTCVRDCPAKAIRISGGQAEVVPERCVGCGNCVRVCTQNAKEVRSGLDEVRGLLASGEPLAACLAPSFPAEFDDLGEARLVGLLRALGFARVHEVAFGADLVARAYDRLLKRDAEGRYIATTCPAIVSYAERYHPEVVGHLAPLVSPMVAQARALRRMHGDALRIVFIGPCIAKKAEAAGDPSFGSTREVDAVLTFRELRELVQSAELDLEQLAPSDFDPPQGDLGALFPISGGMLEAARIREDLLSGDVVEANGRMDFVEAVREFASGDLDARLLEVLCCSGCIMGPGYSQKTPLFRRRSKVGRRVRERLTQIDREASRRAQDALADLDLSREFERYDQRIPAPSPDELQRILEGMGKRLPTDELDCGACGYETCRAHALAIHMGLAEPEMCMPHAIERLRDTVQELAHSNRELEATQEALMHSERLASMGQLAAGIAHEVNNPLGVVLMYSHLMLEDCEADSPLSDDLRMVVEQADRCKKIVSGLLNFSRQNKVLHERLDLGAHLDRCLAAMALPPGIVRRREDELDDPVAEFDGAQLAQVLTNLATNAADAMDGEGTLLVRSGGDERWVWFEVVDQGCGIPEDNLKRVFLPFFTTKQIGRGTGLGLAVSYGIVKMHRGDIKIRSQADPAQGPTGTTVTVRLPRHAQMN